MRSVRFNDSLHIIQAQGFAGTRVLSLVFPSAFRQLGIGAFRSARASRSRTSLQQSASSTWAWTPSASA